MLAAGTLVANLSCGSRSGLFLGAVEDSGSGGIASGGSAGVAQAGRESGRGGGGIANAGAPAGGSRACGLLIDDMEDGSGRICTGEGRQGAWYVFNDDTGTQLPAKTSPGVPIETALILGGRQSSTRAIHTDGEGFRVWGSGIGFDLDFDGTTYRLYDATRYAGIEFWARGAAGQTFSFRVSSASSTAMAYGGTCVPNCAGPSGLTLTVGPDWSHYTVPFAELSVLPGSPPEIDRLTNIQFKSNVSVPFDFWIDDVRFLNSQPSCCADLPQCEGGVRIPDSALNSAILAGRAPTILDCSAVCSLRSVSAATADVRDLEGLECLTSLATLKLSENQITDLGPLSSETTIVDLDLAQNLVSDIGPLRKLTNLARLEISKNEITDLAPLTNITGLSALSASNNRLTDVTPLASLVHLRSLQLSNNLIQDASPLRALVELNTLDLGHNAVSRMDSLSGLTKLTTLSLASNSIDDLGAPSGLPALSTLDLSENRIVDVHSLATLHALTWLGLAKNRITDPSPLSALSSLNSLDLSGNQLQVLSASFHVPSVSMLNLSSNGLKQMASLSGSSFLMLNLAHNGLSDLSALAGVTFNNVPCYRCGTTPGSLDLSDNQLTDLSPLLAAVTPASFSIDVRQNPISCAAQATNIAALRARGVTLSVDCP